MERSKAQFTNADLAEEATENSEWAQSAGVHSKLGKFYFHEEQTSVNQIEFNQQVETYHQLLSTLDVPYTRYVNLAASSEAEKKGAAAATDITAAKQTLMAAYARVIDQAALLLQKSPSQARELVNSTAYHWVEELSRSDDVELISMAGTIIRNMIDKKLPRSIDLLWNEQNAFTDFYLKQYEEKDKKDPNVSWYAPHLITALESSYSLVKNYAPMPGKPEFYEKADYYSPNKIAEAKNKVKRIWQILDERAQSFEAEEELDLTNPRGYYLEMTENVLGEKLQPSRFDKIVANFKKMLAGIGM